MDAAHCSLDKSTRFGVEAFSGKGMLARAFSNHIGPFVTSEVEDDSRDNLLLKEGLLRLLTLLFRACAGGHLHLGTPCKSWVCLSRSYTHRSSINPGGPNRRMSKTGRVLGRAQHVGGALRTANQDHKGFVHDIHT